MNPVLPIAAIRAGQSRDRRDVERIKYPYPVRPDFMVGSFVCRVINVSRMGLKVSAPALLRAEEGTEIRGYIEFQHAGSLFVAGKVVRIVGDLISLQLALPIADRILRIEAKQLVEAF